MPYTNSPYSSQRASILEVTLMYEITRLSYNIYLANCYKNSTRVQTQQSEISEERPYFMMDKSATCIRCKNNEDNAVACIKRPKKADVPAIFTSFKRNQYTSIVESFKTQQFKVIP